MDSANASPYPLMRCDGSLRHNIATAVEKKARASRVTRRTWRRRTFTEAHSTKTTHVRLAGTKSTAPKRKRRQKNQTVDPPVVTTKEKLFQPCRSRYCANSS